MTATIQTADVHVGPCQCTAPLKSRNQPTKDLDCRPRLQTSRHGAQGRGTYALKFHQLMAEMWELLARSRAFFTKPHSLQRPGRPVTMSTYSKAEERILCKSLHCTFTFLLKAPCAACRTGGLMTFKLIFNCPCLSHKLSGLHRRASSDAAHSSSPGTRQFLGGVPGFLVCE